VLKEVDAELLKEEIGIDELLLLHAARTNKVSMTKDSLLVFKLNIKFPPLDKIQYFKYKAKIKDF
jgi:hypothetical protein